MSSSHRELIFHAGMHKTGSTAIQDYLFHQLDDPRVHYFHAGRPNSTLILQRAFDSRQDGRVAEQARQKLQRLIETDSGPLSILSAEGISALEDEDLTALRNFFQCSYNISAVHLYVRPLKSRMESVFQQQLKREYRDLSRPFGIDYNGLAARFDSVFGRSHVHFHRFARADFPDGSVVQHFLQMLNVRCDNIREPDINRALSLPAVQLLYIFRQHFPQRRQEDRHIIDRLSTLPGAPFHLHSSLFRQLLLTRPGALQRFEERAGFELMEDETAHDDVGVRSDRELLEVSPATIEWLQAELSSLGVDQPVAGTQLEDIASGVRAMGA